MGITLFKQGKEENDGNRISITPLPGCTGELRVWEHDHLMKQLYEAMKKPEPEFPNIPLRIVEGL